MPNSFKVAKDKSGPLPACPKFIPFKLESELRFETKLSLVLTQNPYAKESPITTKSTSWSQELSKLLKPYLSVSMMIHSFSLQESILLFETWDNGKIVCGLVFRERKFSGAIYFSTFCVVNISFHSWALIFIIFLYSMYLIIPNENSQMKIIKIVEKSVI